MRVLCTACGHEHNNHHVINHHMSEGHPRRGRFNPDAHCYNCGSVGKMRVKGAGVSAATTTLDVVPLEKEDSDVLARRQAEAEAEGRRQIEAKQAQDKAAEDLFFQQA
jgi:hypothetical protein